MFLRAFRFAPKRSRAPPTAGSCRVNPSGFGRWARMLRGVERRERARALRALADDYSALAARAQALGLGPLADDTREAEAWLRASAGELRRAGRRWRAPRRAGRVA